MAYIGFDLDGTLGDFTPLQEFNEEPLAKDGTFNPEFVRYVRLLAENPYKIFNPELLPIVKLVKEAKYRTNAKKVKAVVLYSNNSNDNLLYLVASALSLMFYADNPQLSTLNQRIFDSIAGRLAPGRPRNTNNPPKTLDYLQGMFQRITGEESIDSRKILFFDDQDHPDLQRALGETYLKVIPYERSAFQNPKTLQEIQMYFQTAVPPPLPPNPPSSTPGPYNNLFGKAGGGTRRNRKHKKTRKQKKSSPKRR